MKNKQEKNKMFKVAPLDNPNLSNSKFKSSPPIFNIDKMKRLTNEIKGTYSPFCTKKRNNDGNFIYEEYICVVKCKCIRNFTIIEEDKKTHKSIYFYLIEYKDNQNLLKKIVNLEEIYFEDDIDFLYLKTIELDPVTIHNKKRKINKIKESISPNENMFQNIVTPRLTIDINI